MGNKSTRALYIHRNIKQQHCFNVVASQSRCKLNYVVCAVIYTHTRGKTVLFEGLVIKRVSLVFSNAEIYP